MVKKGKSITLTLGVLAAVIWGNIILRVSTLLSSDYSLEFAPGFVTSHENADMHRAFVYKADVRDPFYPVALSSVRKSTKKLLTDSAFWTPPPFKLLGALANAKKKTIILEGSDGTVFFLQQGDTLQGVKVLRIRDRLTSYSYRGKESQWQLEGD